MHTYTHTFPSYHFLLCPSPLWLFFSHSFSHNWEACCLWWHSVCSVALNSASRVFSRSRCFNADSNKLTAFICILKSLSASKRWCSVGRESKYLVHQCPLLYYSYLCRVQGNLHSSPASRSSIKLSLKPEHVFCYTSFHPVIPLAGVRVKASFPSISSCSLLPPQQTASSGRARQSRVRLCMLVRVSHCCNWWQFKV